MNSGMESMQGHVLWMVVPRKGSDDDGGGFDHGGWYQWIDGGHGAVGGFEGIFMAVIVERLVVENVGYGKGSGVKGNGLSLWGEQIQREIGCIN